MPLFATVDRLRRPEYTGENRCLPCTILNSAIALLLAVVLGTVWLPLGPATIVVAGSVIYLRGYLVPGTPRLTARYLPESVLAWFEQYKAPPAPDVDLDDDTDVGEVLFELGVLEECQDGLDFCLTDDFHAAWREEIDRLRSAETERADLAELIDADPESLTFDDYDEGFVARVNNVRVGQWESEAALLADLGAARALDREVAGWQGFDVPTKGALLNGLRLFVDTCPACGGAVTLAEETVKSCCRSLEVVAATCESCESRLFEASQVDEDAPGI